MMSMNSDLRSQVAWSCRILAMNGHADMTLGHVSARGPEKLIYIKRKGIGLDEVTPKDIVAIDLDGKKVEGDGEIHLESPLHTEIYRLREDIGAVVHTHPPYATALSATKAKLEMLNHDSLLFHDGLAYFEENAGLVSNAALGEAVAGALGSQKAILMRNHGVLVVGKSVPWATYISLTLERAVKIQCIATNLGSLAPLKNEKAERIFGEKYRDDFTESYWEHLIRKARRNYSSDDLTDFATNSQAN